MGLDKELTRLEDTYKVKYLASSKNLLARVALGLVKYGSIMAGVYDLSDGKVNEWIILPAAMIYFLADCGIEGLREVSDSKKFSLLEKEIKGL